MATTETTKRDITTTISADYRYLTLDFANGKQLVIDVDTLDDSIRKQSTIHGLKQKHVDAAAISRDPVTGGTADIETKYQAVLDVYNRITDSENPQWNKQRGDGTGSSGGNGLLFRALVRLYPGKTAEFLQAYIAGKTKQEQAALRASKKISAMIEIIKSETIKTTGVDVDSLLDELDS